MTESAATVYDAISSTARKHAHAAALVFGGRVFTYEDFMDLVENAAGALVAAGVCKGATFAVYSQNCPEILAAYCAAAKIGAVMVPINPNMTATEVAGVMTHCEAQVLFHDQAMAEAAEKAAPAGRRNIDELVRSAQPAPLVSDTRPDDDFTIVYTSGSTGTPKAIVLSHGSQVHVLSALAEMWALSASDITVVALPLGYLYGLSTAAIAGLRAGGKVVLLRRFHPGDTLKALVERRATVFHGVPTMFSMMLDYAEQQDLSIDLSGMRALICAGAPLADELRARFERRFGKVMQNYYALSECTPVFGAYAADPNPIPPGCLGRLAPMAQVKIVDEMGKGCPQGTPGELLVRGASLMSRYHGDPENTRRVFVNGWFKTGDLACESSPGYFSIVGRKKDIIIRGGANISPSEIEATLMRHPAVQSVAVVGLPDGTFGELPAAVVVLRGGAKATPEELSAFAARELAEFKIPARFAFVAEMPLGQTGKIDRNALKARHKELFT